MAGLVVPPDKRLLPRYGGDKEFCFWAAQCLRWKTFRLFFKRTAVRGREGRPYPKNLDGFRSGRGLPLFRRGRCYRPQQPANIGVAIGNRSPRALLYRDRASFQRRFRKGRRGAFVQLHNGKPFRQKTCRQFPVPLQRRELRPPQR